LEIILGDYITVGADTKVRPYKLSLLPLPPIYPVTQAITPAGLGLIAQFIRPLKHALGREGHRVRGPAQVGGIQAHAGCDL